MMKISKNFVGREVKITWKDPTSERVALSGAKKGREALATWIEYGVIDDITDGVVRFVQSLAYSAGMTTHDEGIFGWVPEELIEKCELLVAEKEVDGK